MLFIGGNELDAVSLQQGQTLLSAMREQAVQDQGRNGDGETQFGGDEGLGDAAGEFPGITCAEDGDEGERFYHADDGAQEPEERGGCRDHGQHGEPAFVMQALAKNERVEVLLNNLFGVVGVAQSGGE